ncbi:MAG: CDP-alcohol phosphatidyltransferase family protein [Ignavibacteria bacterium]|nr:CDP-alcohol phosphatidyltransferase family protein [Ignavibacteria bacterium]
MKEKFPFQSSLKTNPENDFLNLQSYLFITSKQLTRLFYYSKVTPHQVILLSMLFGLSASYLIILNDKILILIGAALLFYKNVLDKVDGSLARAKGLDSRRGRFYDSISDFIVTLSSFGAISYFLSLKYTDPGLFVIGFAAMISSMLQCSYFIYYQVSFIKNTGKNTVNRIDESITDEDKIQQDKWTTFLQRIFLLIYGWQDKLFNKIDKYLFMRFISNSCESTLSSRFDRERNPDLAGQETHYTKLWYQNKPFLTLASSLSIGTHIFLICIAAIIGAFEYYLFVNLICMNLLLIYSIIFHYRTSKKQLLSN